MKVLLSNDEYEAALGDSIKQFRLLRNIDRQTLCDQCGISLTALKNLESGSGASIKTLIKVLRGLGKADWLLTIAPVATINPMTLTARNSPRQRAHKKSKDI